MTHPHSRAALEKRIGPNFRWYALFTVMIGAMASVMVSVMASTTINVAVPDMSRVFALGQERAQWLSAGFMAAMTLSMLTTPWLLERFGYRNTYTGAVLPRMAGGMCGGMCGGLSRWFELVLAMRVVEGLAAGVLQPIPAIIVMRGSAAASRAGRWASSASAWCWRRSSGPASVACWSSGSAGVRSSSSSCPSASLPRCWRGAFCRSACRAAAR